MRSDRHESPSLPYRWRGPLPDARPKDYAVKWLVVLNVMAFILVDMVHPVVAHSLILSYCVSFEALAAGRWWTLLTHMFLHGGLVHLVANMVALYSFGRALEDAVGAGKMIAIYFVGGISGGLLQSCLVPSIPLVGASGGVFALVVAFCWLHWGEKIHLLLVFFIPLNVKGRSLAAGLLLSSLALGLWAQANPMSHHVLARIGHWAHLGGGFAGFVLGYFWLRGRSLARQLLIRQQESREVRRFPEG